MNISDFKSLIKEMAGSSYHNIEVSDTVFDNHIIPATLDFFEERHYDGATPYIYELSLTSGTIKYDLSGNSITAVTRIMKPKMHGIIGRDITSLKYLYERNPMMFESGDIVEYQHINSMLRQYEISFNWYFDFRYNRTTEELTLTNPGDYNTVWLHCYISDVDEHKESILDNYLVQELALARTLIYWGRSLTKYDRELMGGVRLQTQEIIQEGKELLEKTEEKIKEEYSEAPDILIG